MLDSIKDYVKLLRIRQLAEVERGKRADLPSRFDGLPPDVWDLSINGNGHLACGDIDLIEVARTYGTPLHVISRARLLKDYSAFVGAFRRRLPKVELATSYKTNPLPAVLSTLHRAGTWAEVISPFELWLALELKVAPDRIVLNGPGKGGLPIVLLVEHPSTGGYPKIASVISADLSALAQLRPGDEVRFAKVSLDAARRLLLEREVRLGTPGGFLP